jgi:hypothetical protein
VEHFYIASSSCGCDSFSIEMGKSYETGSFPGCGFTLRARASHPFLGSSSSQGTCEANKVLTSLTIASLRLSHGRSFLLEDQDLVSSMTSNIYALGTWKSSPRAIIIGRTLSQRE